MAITGRLLNATFSIATDGSAVTMTANVTLIDDQLGVIGGRSINQDDPQIVGAVEQFIIQMLPSLEAKAGFPVSLPKPPSIEVSLEPKLPPADGPVPSDIPVPPADPQVIK